MADFRVLGRIEPIGLGQFFVIASSAPEDTQRDEPRAIVLTWTTTNLADANATCKRLMVEVGNKVRARGDRVVDVETED